MNQEKSGKFIAQCRREKGLTQAGLAELFHITDRAVSKWETGKSMPDISIMPALCSVLGITVNELLSGERLDMDEYNKKAEENLIEFRKFEEKETKKKLMLEVVFGVIGTAVLLLVIFVSIIAEMKPAMKITVVLTGGFIFAVCLFFALYLERDAGYYECRKCCYKYVPNIMPFLFAPHSGRKRYMKCPHCHKYSWHKKTAEKQ